MNPFWEQDVVDLETLCNYNLEREIQISIWDTPSRTLLGWCYTTVHGLLGAVSERGNAEKSFDIMKPSESLLPSTMRLGKLVVLHASVSSSHATMPPHLATVTTARGEPLREESLSKLPQAVAVEIMTPPPMRQDYTFEDYTANDKCTLELCVAIDFSRANGT